MIDNFLNILARHKGSVDAILILNKEGLVEYSAILSNENKGFKSEGIVGKSILEVYPSLSEETSSHHRVLKSGIPIINENQTVVDTEGKSVDLLSSTFPIYFENEIIGTYEASKFLSNEMNSDKKSTSHLYRIDDIITKNDKMIALKNKILQLAATENSILITGDTGTGKELFAQAVHYHSLRSEGPFVSVNVAAIPDSLLESTLFGTVKGSFTGAEDRIGLFEKANFGTLFLDELNSMDLNMQSKILRAIETKKIKKVGGNEDINLDIRFISAMNVSGEEAIKKNNLRLDLFFRLAASQFHIPCLSERKDDIDLLAEYFLGEGFLLSPMVKKILEEYPWPGNIRELKNTMNYASSIASSTTIKINNLPEYLMLNRVRDQVFDKGNDRSLAEMTSEFEKEIIVRVLGESRTLTEASNKLKLTRQALKYKMNKYGIHW